jgi:hypothetical protein
MYSSAQSTMIRWVDLSRGIHAAVFTRPMNGAVQASER